MTAVALRRIGTHLFAPEANLPSSLDRMSMGAALAVSWGSMLVHNLYEIPRSAIDLENSGPLVVAAVLGLAYAFRPDSAAVVAALLGWGGLNLLVGGVLSVLPLPILPFAPEQSLSHYSVHVAYSLGQIPLIVLALRSSRGRGRVRDQNRAV